MDLHSATLNTFWLWVWFNRANHSSVSLKSVQDQNIWSLFWLSCLTLTLATSQNTLTTSAQPWDHAGLFYTRGRGSGVVWLAAVRGLLTGKAISISDKRECCKCCGRRISRIRPGRPSVPVLSESLIDPGGIIECANVSFEAFEKRVWW